MTKRRRKLLVLAKRISAIAVGVGLMFGRVEQFLPDAHDGDAATAVATSDASDHSSSAPIQHDGHAVHVDHCSHAHAFDTSTPAAADRGIELSRSLIDWAAVHLVSIDLPPHQRPPIA